MVEEGKETKQNGHATDACSYIVGKGMPMRALPISQETQKFWGDEAEFHKIISQLNQRCVVKSPPLLSTTDSPSFESLTRDIAHLEKALQHIKKLETPDPAFLDLLQMEIDWLSLKREALLNNTNTNK